MRSAEKLDLRMTAEEYAVWEREQTERHEFFAGEVFLRAGAARRHGLIGSNILGEVRQLIKDSDCQAYGSDVRVHIEATGYQAYPDVFVVCPPVQGASSEVISNPVLIVEVLSPSTADFDRGGKFGENLSWLRRMTLSLIKQHPSKHSNIMKRHMAGWSVDFLMQILTGKAT